MSNKQISFKYHEINYNANVHILNTEKGFTYFVSFIDKILKQKFRDLTFYDNGYKELCSVGNPFEDEEKDIFKNIISKALYTQLF